MIHQREGCEDSIYPPWAVGFGVEVPEHASLVVMFVMPRSAELYRVGIGGGTIRSRELASALDRALAAYEASVIQKIICRSLQKYP